MRRFPDLTAALLLVKRGFIVGAVGLGSILSPILLNSCQNVQPEDTSRTDGAASAAEPSPNASESKSGSQPTDQGLQGTTAKEDLVGVAGVVSTDQAGTTGPLTPISAATRRSARGLPTAVWGYPSWCALEDPEALVIPQGTDDECRAYIDLPLEVEATIGERLALPLEKRTTIVIESKRGSDGFIRRIDTLKRGDSGWELRCFVRERPTESFEEESADSHPEDAACRKLLAALEEGKASLILGE